MTAHDAATRTRRELHPRRRRSGPLRVLLPAVLIWRG